MQVDDWDKPSLKIRALNEGNWGNTIWFRCVHAPGAQALLTRDLDIGSGEAHVNQTRGFEVGSLVRIYDRENSDFVVITEIGDKLVKWGVETPVNRRHRAAAPTHLEVMTFEIHVAMRDRREVFKGLQMHPSSRQYAPKVIAQRSRLVRVEDLHTKSPVPHNLPEPLPMTRLSGGRDGLDALTPEDFIGLDLGPGERSGLRRARARTKRSRCCCVPMRCASTTRSPVPRASQGAPHPGRDGLALREPEGPLRDPRHPAEQGHRVGAALAAAHRFELVLRVLLAVAACRSASTTRSTSSRRPATSPAATRARDLETACTTRPRTSRSSASQDVALRVTEDHIGILNSDVDQHVPTAARRPAVGGAHARHRIPSGGISRSDVFSSCYGDRSRPGSRGSRSSRTTSKTWDLVRDRTQYFLAELHTKGMLAGRNPEEAFFVRCDAENNPSDQVDNGHLALRHRCGAGNSGRVHHDLARADDGQPET